MNNKNLTPFKMCTLKNFPFIEADFDAITNYELLCKIVEYLNNVIANQNEISENVQNLSNAFTQLQEYVVNYFDNLDVQEEINNKLDDMATDGTLDTIINKYIMIQENNYIKDKCTLAYRPTGESRGLQGGCYCGSGLIACYFSTSNTIQIISLSTGQVLREYSNEIFGHGNGICKVGNYLYLLGTGDSSTNNVYKIPFDTLDSYEVVDVFADGLIPAGSGISSICYSPTTEQFYITLGLPFPTLTCYVMNSDFTEVVGTYTYDNGSSSYGGFITNICYWNHYIVVNYNYGKTQLFKETDFTLYKQINIDKNVGNRYYSEIEWLDSYDSSNLIIGAICHNGENYGNGIFSFGLCNLYSSTRDYPGQYRKGKSTAGETTTKQNNVFVNTNADFNVLRDGTQDKPFISIYEAFNSTQVDGFDETIIRIVSGSDISDEGLYLYNTKKVSIIAPDMNMLCRDVRIQTCPSVYIRGICPINTMYLKECNVTLYATPSNETTIELEGYNTSTLNIATTANKIKLIGSSAGIINFNNCNTENGIVGILNSSGDGYTDFVKCRNINNVAQRCRLAGASYTASGSMIFFINQASYKNIYVQVGSMYVNLPEFTFAKTVNIDLPDGTQLNYKVTVDTTTYTGSSVLKIELTHATLTIYDAYVTY